MTVPRLFLFLVLAGCGATPVSTEGPPPVEDELTPPTDSGTSEPIEVDNRIRSISFGMRFGVAADGRTLATLLDSDGEELPSLVWFALGNQDGDRCSIMVPVDGLQLEVLTDEPQAYAFEVPDAALAETDCLPETHDTSWFPGGDAVSQVTEWRFEWGGPLNPDVFDWTEVEDGEEYYVGAKVAGPLMSAPEKDVVFVRGYEVDDNLALPPGELEPILAEELVIDGAAPSAAYEFTVPWAVVYTWP